MNCYGINPDDDDDNINHDDNINPDDNIKPDDNNPGTRRI